MVIPEEVKKITVIVHSAITEVGEKSSRFVPLFPGNFTGSVPDQTKSQIMEQIKEGGIKSNDMLKAIRSNLDSMICEVARNSKFVLRVKPGLRDTLLKIIEQHNNEKNQEEEDNNLLLM